MKACEEPAHRRARRIVSLLFTALVLSGCAIAWVGASATVEPSATAARATVPRLASTETALPQATFSRGGLGENNNSSQTAAEAAPVNDEPPAAAADIDPFSSTAPEVPDAQPASHTVKAGDTLTRIAQRYDVSIKALQAANDLPNPDFLEVGQVINLPQAPVEYTASFRILPDSRMVRSAGAHRFDIEAFLRSQPGPLHRMTLAVPTRLADGSQREDQLSGSQVIARVSREYSVDGRLLLAFLEHFAGLATDPAADEESRHYPILAPAPSSGILRAGLYNQLSWLADQLNKGYYDWKYRGRRILEFADGSRLNYHPDLNAGAIAVQFAVAQIRNQDQWRADIGEAGFYATYQRLFGDPFADTKATPPADLSQPTLTLPFPRGDAWRFTGGFHGGWGNGSAWSAVDFAPPDKDTRWCYTSSFPIIAVARGKIARMDEGVIVLDLDEDGDEGSGWTILYLHVSAHDALREGQVVDAGNILGYTSCAGGFSTATHLHIARRYNGEWIPADCNRCPAGVSVPPFVMSGWKVVGLGSQLYQGFLVDTRGNRSVIAEQGRYTDVNAISW